MILGLLYVSFAVESVDRTRRIFKELFGLPGEHVGPDSFVGADRGARIAFPNECWLYVVESRQPDSPVFQFIQERGAGLERLAFLTDDIETEFDRVRQGGVVLNDSVLLDTPSGHRFVVPPEYVNGVRVELFQPRASYWASKACDNAFGVFGLQHIGIAARDIEATCNTFERLFDLPSRDMRIDQHGGMQKDMTIAPGNNRLWLHVVQSWDPNARAHKFLEEKGEGLEHICIEVDDVCEAVKRVADAGVPLFEHKIYTNRPDGFEAFIYPEHTTGATVELIEPYPASRGYRPRRESIRSVASSDRGHGRAPA